MYIYEHTVTPSLPAPVCCFVCDSHDVITDIGHTISDASSTHTSPAHASSFMPSRLERPSSLYLELQVVLQCMCLPADILAGAFDNTTLNT